MKTVILACTLFCCNKIYCQSDSPGNSDTTWWSKAIVYEITPYLFVNNGHFTDIKAKLSELKSLGVNTIWLQPVFETYGKGQGYDIIDYDRIRSDLGTEAHLRSLIDSAHHLGLRVILDFPANHTSIHHPYAQDRIQKAKASTYYNYYQSANDHALYSSDYHKTNGDFIYYFWKDLVNLQLNDTATQQWMINSCKNWVTRLNIDGYRFDAAWGFNARSSSFTQKLTQALKTLKPSLLLLAEDKGSTATPYNLGFNAAYDWASDTNWISHWSWEYDYTDDNSMTIFNNPSISTRKTLLEKALFQSGNYGLRLRFMENNDMHRFISNHSSAVTKMVAEMMFTLPGMPLIYNGQEIADDEFPYESGPIFKADKTIRSLNTSWFDFYKQLNRLRSHHISLTGNSFKEIHVTNANAAVAYQRHNDKEDILVAVNLDGSSCDAVLHLDDNILPAQSKGLSFTDLITGDTTIAYSQSPGTIHVHLNATSTSILLLNSNIIMPAEANKNYNIQPNPTSGNFSVTYNSARAGVNSFTLFTLEGVKLWTVEKQVTAGPVKLNFDISNEPADTYLLKISDSKGNHVLKIVKQ